VGAQRRSDVALFQVQAEYLHREEDGSLTFDADGTVGVPSDSYQSKQSGWHGVPTSSCRAGASGCATRNWIAARWISAWWPAARPIAADFPLLAENDPKRTTAMVDFSPSDFSRLRLQFSRDEARFNESDNQIFLQYIMSLGVHGAHKF
jgi:hypothetical protein